MDLGIAARPKRGESLSGDAYFVGECDGTVFLAVIDGIGHGEHANSTANKATLFLAKHLHLDLIAMIRGCHQELRGSRGAVIGLVSINKSGNVLSYAGIGNIEGRLIKEGSAPAEERTCATACPSKDALNAGETKKVRHLISMNGIVGCNLRKVTGFQHTCHTGDTIAMFSDGISSRIDLSEFLPADDLQKAAEKILDKHGKDDDATILLARL
ncbi:MAG: hypothetical protein WC749_04165 [Dehalococcoidia bacterium]